VDFVRLSEFCFLDGENLELAKEELSNYTQIIEEYGRFLIVKSFNYPFLALTKLKGLFLGKFEEIPSLNLSFRKGIIQVYSNLNLSKEEKKQIIQEFLDKNPIKFDPSSKNKIIIYKTKNYFLIGLTTWERESFKDREPNKRPFNRPFTLKPKFARALVNIGFHNFIVDPFVGTGTILIEAAYTRRDYFGIERDWNVIKGSIKNFKHFNLIPKVVLSDALFIDKLLCNLKKDFSIVTDPPYGKSSSLFDKKIEELYYNFLSKATKIKNLRKMVFIVRKESDLDDLILGFKPKKYIDHFVNSNVTRRIFIFEFDTHFDK